MTSFRKRFGTSASLLATLTLTACLSEMPRTLPTEQPVPEPHTLFVPSFVPVVERSTMDPNVVATPNSVKYRDSGARFSARLGMAPLEFRALIGKDDSTLVE